MNTRTGWLPTGIAVTFGAVIVACHIESGRQRWAAAAWRYAALVPGSPSTWGVLVLAAGLLLAYGHVRKARRVLVAGYSTVFLWFCVLAAAAAAAVTEDLVEGTRQANPLAVVAWLGFAVLYADAADKLGKRRA